MKQPILVSSIYAIINATVNIFYIKSKKYQILNKYQFIFYPENIRNIILAKYIIIIEFNYFSIN